MGDSRASEGRVTYTVIMSVSSAARSKAHLRRPAGASSFSRITPIGREIATAAAAGTLEGGATRGLSTAEGSVLESGGRPCFTDDHGHTALGQCALRVRP